MITMTSALIILKSSYKGFLKDSRVKRHARTLHNAGYDVKVLLVDNPKNVPEGGPYNILCVDVPDFWNSKGRSRASQLRQQLKYYSKGKKLINQNRPDILILNDVNTLPFSKCKAEHIIYDSHELWHDLIEYHGYVKGKTGLRIFGAFERKYVKKIDSFITVSDSLSRILSDRFSTKFHVIRNIPDIQDKSSIDIRKKNKLPAHQFVIVHTGSISENRGLKEMGKIMLRLHNENKTGTSFVFYGIDPAIKEKLTQYLPKGAMEQHRFNGSIDQAELYPIISTASIGIVLMKKTNLNNYYALPNKFFEYLLNGLPVICSNFPEMKSITEKYDIGWLVDPSKPDMIYSSIIEAQDKNLLEKRKANISSLKQDLNWKNEEKKLIAIVEKLLIN